MTWCFWWKGFSANIFNTAESKIRTAQSEKHPTAALKKGIKCPKTTGQVLNVQISINWWLFPWISVLFITADMSCTFWSVGRSWMDHRWSDWELTRHIRRINILKVRRPSHDIWASVSFLHLISPNPNSSSLCPADGFLQPQHSPGSRSD